MFSRTTLRGATTVLLVTLLCAAPVAIAEDVYSVMPTDDLPPWATDDALQLNLTVGGEVIPTQYTVAPALENMGGDVAKIGRGILQLNGDLKLATPSNYNDINNSNDIAYLSCDSPNDDSFIEPLKMLNDLMRAKPKAIVLYSSEKYWCKVDLPGPLEYDNLLSTADFSEVKQVLEYFNITKGSVKASISGNNTNSDSSPSHHGPNRSSVAMSILYTITGLVTLLFVAIIATGAVRAHRYPERYGPRLATGGRPRQSRAKGIARAVLDTIPIVKFNNQQPAKPDPEFELETGTTDGRDVGPHRTNSDASRSAPGGTVAGGPVAATPRNSNAPDQAESIGAAHLGCTICTEDFEVGEDVRVLPCSHQFHPNCIDPWLINVSGTCPLCRFDLRKGHSNRTSTAEDGSTLPPPIAWDAEDGDGDGSSTPQRTRLSRLFDINRLRQATREEQMETLRQIVAERRARVPTEADMDERRQGTGFADKLKEKFRVRTRAQSPRRRST